MSSSSTSKTTTSVVKDRDNDVGEHPGQMDDDDYEEPVWQAGKIDGETGEPADMDELLKAASQKRIKLWEFSPFHYVRVSANFFSFWLGHQN